MFDITIIVPTFNSQTTLLETLESINKANFEDLKVEVLVVDDESTDDTVKRFNEFDCIHTLRFFQLEEHRGKPFGLNRGLIESRGEYIAILDSDDIALRNRFLKPYEILQTNKSLDVVAGQYLQFGDWGISKNPSTFGIGRNSITASYARGQNPIAHSSVMFRKSWALQTGFYNECLKYGQDYEFFLRGFKGENYFILNEVLFLYRCKKKFQDFDYFFKSDIYRRAINQHIISGDSISAFVEKQSSVRSKIKSMFKYSMLWLRFHFIDISLSINSHQKA